jgi:hypothetical protein
MFLMCAFSRLTSGMFTANEAAAITWVYAFVDDDPPFKAGAVAATHHGLCRLRRQEGPSHGFRTSTPFQHGSVMVLKG